MARVKKPGCIVFVATEYLLPDDIQHPEYFTKQQIIDYLINATDELELFDGMSWELPPLPFLLDQVCTNGEGVH